MNLAEIVKMINKYHIPIIISVVVLLFYVSIIVTAPPFGDGVVEFDDFRVLIPNDAEYNEITDGVKITGSPIEYVSEITVTKDGADLYDDAYYELDKEGYYPSVTEFNDTHYDVYMELSSTIDPNSDYYNYDFIIPKKDYDDSTYELKKENTKMGIVRAYDKDFGEYLVHSFKW